MVRGLHLQRSGDGRGEFKHDERFSTGTRRDGLRTRISDPEVLETRACGGESTPGFIGEDAVGDVGADFGRAFAGEHLGALDEGTAGLHEVIDDDDVLTRWFAFLDGDDAFFAFTNLGADDFFVFGEKVVKAFARAFVVKRCTRSWLLLVVCSP